LKWNVGAHRQILFKEWEKKLEKICKAPVGCRYLKISLEISTKIIFIKKNHDGERVRRYNHKYINVL